VALVTFAPTVAITAQTLPVVRSISKLVSLLLLSV
jgi:hypothetical protein